MRTVNKTKKEDLLKGIDLRYDTHHDAAMRLAGTIVRYEGTPVYVSDFDGSTAFLGRPMEPDKYNYEFWMIDANDRNLDISSIPLGYININDPVFALRGAHRSQRQGVDVSRLHYYSPKRQDFAHVAPTEEFMMSFGKVELNYGC